MIVKIDSLWHRIIKYFRILFCFNRGFFLCRIVLPDIISNDKSHVLNISDRIKCLSDDSNRLVGNICEESNGGKRQDGCQSGRTDKILYPLAYIHTVIATGIECAVYK